MSDTATEPNATEVDDTKVAQDSQLAVQRAREIVISDDKSLQAAGEFLIEVKKILKEINITFDGAIGAAYKAHREIGAAKKRHADPLLFAEETVKVSIGRYTDEQERLRLAEEARLRREQEQRDREVREAKARADQAARDEEEARLKLAAELEDAGHQEEADAVLDAAPEPEPEPVVETLPVAPPPAPPVQAKGVATRRIWKHVTVDASLLPREFLMPDENKIKRQVSATQGDTKIPGVRVYSEAQVSARA